MFGVKPQTILKWGKKGILKPSIYIATRPRYRLEDIEKVGNQTQTRIFKKSATT